MKDQINLFSGDGLKPGQVRLHLLDLNKSCERDLRTGKGIVIKEKPFTKDVKNYHGLQSDWFGTSWESGADGFKDRYTCKCGSTMGKKYEGKICPECGHEVKLIDVDLDKFGWIILKEHYLIHPICYKFLETIIGVTTLKDIIAFNRKPDKNGNVLFDAEDDKKNPYRNIGLIEFRERFEEILDFYRKKKKDKGLLIDLLIAHKDQVFIYCIPVFSSVLRTSLVRGERLFSNKFDTCYNKIFSSVESLNNNREVSIVDGKKKTTIPTYIKLAHLQKSLMELWKLVFEQIDKKTGHIKDSVLAGRVNYSSRQVIVPDPTLKADEIRMGYIGFLELFKFEIIAYLTKTQNITEAEAYDEWYKATITFSPKVFAIMTHMVKNKKKHVLINRNPTIDYGSIILMRIVEVTPDMEDFTMSIPISILSGLNADFDGDILNIFVIHSKKMVKELQKFNPRKAMVISRNDGLFDSNMGLLKDQIIGLYQFNNI